MTNLEHKIRHVIKQLRETRHCYVQKFEKVGLIAVCVGVWVTLLNLSLTFGDQSYRRNILYKDHSYMH